MLKLQNKKAIFWDIDGTIFSSEEMIHRVYKNVFENTKKKFGWPQKSPTLDEIINEIGKPVKTIFLNLVPEITEEQRDFLSLQILHNLVQEITFGKGHYYPEFYEVLNQLHKQGYRFFAASNGRFPYVEAILRFGDVIHLFESVECIDHKDIHTKNDLVSWLLKKSELQSSEVVLIGDRSSDREAAQNNNIDFIACTFGHGSPEEWKGAVCEIDSLNDLAKILL